MHEAMKAVVLHGREDLRVETVPRPRAAPGELVLRVGAALTCGTDLKVYRRGYHARMLQPPIPFGHELAGVVVEAGEGVTAFREGDRVVALNSAPCGRCFWCGKGQQNLCDDLLFNNGAYAEYMCIPARIVETNVLPVPEDMPLEHAALVEPLACVVHGFAESAAVRGDRMAVIGAGPIGLMWMQVAATEGVSVIAVVKRAEQAETARRFGAVDVVTIEDGGDAVEEVRALTAEGRGVDVAVDAVASPETWEQAVAMVRRGGVVNFFGGPPSGTSVRLDTNMLHYGDLTLKASFHHTPETVRRAFALLQDKDFRAGQYITGRAELQEVPAIFAQMLRRGEPAMQDGAGDAAADGGTVGIKTVVLPTGEAL